MEQLPFTVHVISIIIGPGQWLASSPIIPDFSTGKEGRKYMGVLTIILNTLLLKQQISRLSIFWQESIQVPIHFPFGSIRDLPPLT